MCWLADSDYDDPDSRRARKRGRAADDVEYSDHEEPPEEDSEGDHDDGFSAESGDDDGGGRRGSRSAASSSRRPLRSGAAASVGLRASGRTSGRRDLSSDVAHKAALFDVVDVSLLERRPQVLASKFSGHSMITKADCSVLLAAEEEESDRHGSRARGGS